MCCMRMRDQQHQDSPSREASGCSVNDFLLPCKLLALPCSAGNFVLIIRHVATQQHCSPTEHIYTQGQTVCPFAAATKTAIPPESVMSRQTLVYAGQSEGKAGAISGGSLQLGPLRGAVCATSTQHGVDPRQQRQHQPLPDAAGHLARHA